MSNNHKKPEEKPPVVDTSAGPLPTIEELEAEMAEGAAELPDPREPDIAFVVPFLPSTDDSEGHGKTAQPNYELLEMYLRHARTFIDAKTLEALQNGAEVGVRVAVFLDFE